MTITKKADRSAKTMPRAVQNKLKALLQSLKVSGPIQPLFWHYSKLGDNKYHCHIAFELGCLLDMREWVNKYRGILCWQS
ncbi:hypothetical protein IKQ19_11990 [Candidatus Saccharibacteria bacterium]|nr:hypothetical protein [Candidatus Saccharibacteria bacterium]